MSEPKILIVEDESIIALNIQSLLIRKGYGVVDIVYTADEAISYARKKKPDCVIMDIMIDGVPDGITAAETIHKELDIPVIFLTAYSDIENYKNAFETDPYGYLVKPLNPAELYPTVEIAIHKHHVNKKLKESEARYRAVVEDQTELICRYTSNWLLTFVNSAYARYFQHSKEDMVGTSFLLYIPKEEQNSVIENIRKLSPDNPVLTHEHRILLTDGSLKWMQWTNHALFDEEKHLLEYQGVGRDITDRKVLERRLIQQRDRAQMYLNIAEVMFVAIDADEKVILINKKGCEILGFSEDQIVGKNWFSSFLPPKTSAGIRKVFQELMNGNDIAIGIVENKVLTAGGDERIIRWHNSVIRDENGIITGTLSSGEDITEQKHVKQQKQVLENQYRILAENISDVIWIVDPDINLLYISPSIFKLSGYTQEEALNLKLEKVFSKQLKSHIVSIYRNMVKDARYIEKENGISAEIETEHFHKNGSSVWIENRISFLETADGKPYAIIGITRDITERKRIENELRESVNKFKVLYDNVPLSYQSLDSKGNILDVNPTWLSVMKYERDDVIGKWFGSFLEKEYVASFEKNFTQLKIIGLSHDVEFVLRRKDDSLIYVSFDASVSYNDDGEFRQTHCIFRDISEFFKTEKELIETEEKYRSIVENSLISAIIIQEGNVLFVNDAIVQLSGYTKEELLALKREEIFEMVHPEDRTLVIKRLEARLAGKFVPAIYDIRIIRKDKQIRWLEVSPLVIYNNGKQAIQIFAVDITKRVEAEKSLRFRTDFEELLARISIRFINVEMKTFDEEIENVLGEIGIFASIDRGYVLLFNENGNEIYNFHEWCAPGIESRKEAFSSIVSKLFSQIMKDMLSRSVLTVDNVAELSDDDKGVKKLYLSSGIKSFVLIPIEIRGEILGFIGFDSIKKVKKWSYEVVHILKSIGTIFAHAFDRRRVELRLRDTEERYDALYERSLDGVYLHDFQGNFIDANDVALKIAGYNRDEIQSLNITDLLDEVQLQIAIKIIEELVAHGTQREIISYKIKKKDGSYAWIETKGSLLYKDGKPYAVQSLVRDITEREETINKLKLTQFSLDSASVSIFWVTPDGAFIYVNNAACALLGYKKDELLGMSINQIDPNYPVENRIDHWKTIVKEKVIHFESIHRTKDNKLLPVMITSTYVKYGHHEYEFAFVLDISKRKDVEDRLKVSRELLKKTFASLQDTIIILDAVDEVIIDCNPALEEMFGYKKDELIGLSSSVLHVNKNYIDDFHGNMFKEIEKHGFMDKFQFWMKHKNGKVFPTEHVVVPFVNANGEQYGYVSVIRDVTEQREYESKLVEQLNFMNILIDTIPNPVFYKDTDGKYLGCNKAFEEFLGKKKDEIIGKTVYYVSSKEFAEFYDKKDLELFKNPGTQVYDGVVINSKGENRDVLFYKATFKDSQDNVSGIIGIIHDITDQRNYDKQMQSNLEEKETLLKEIHHRVKNNMQVISSMVSLGTHEINDEKVQDALLEIKGRIRSMGMVHEMMYQTESLSIIGIKHYTDALIAEIMSMYSAGKDITINLDIDEIYFNIDIAIPCALILYELISNSLKHAFPDSKNGEVSIAIKKMRSNKYKLIVSDNGIGIPRNINFENSNSLGLELVSSLTTQLEGTIKVIRNKGTKVVLSFG